MGKTALLLVTISLIGISVMNSNRNRREFETKSESAEYQDRVVAREIATSGFNVIVARLSRDFAGKRGTWTDVRYGDGTYTVSVTGPVEGPATVSVTGTYGGQDHSITAEYALPPTTPWDAVTLVGTSLISKLKGGHRVSGLSLNLDGSPGSGDDVHAFRSNDAGTHATLLGEIVAAQSVGVDGPGDALLEEPEADIDDLFDRVLAYSGPERSDYPSGLAKSTSVGLGTKDSPKIVVVSGKATLNAHATGYGILLVSGRLTMDKYSRWNGLVLVTDDGSAPPDRIVMKKDATIFGAIVGRFASTTAVSDFDMADDSRVQYSVEALQMLNALIPGIGPGTGDDGMVLIGANSSSTRNADFVNNGRRGPDEEKNGNGTNGDESTLNSGDGH